MGRDIFKNATTFFAGEKAAEVRTAFAEAKGRYGSPRLHRSLLARGSRSGVNTVAMLMWWLGLAACRPRRRPRPPGPGGARGDATRNALDRQFSTTRPDEKWVSDIAYLATGEAWLYLAAVENLFSRRVVGLAMGDALDAGLVSRALGMAVSRRRPGPGPGLLVHTDRGCQSTSGEYPAATAGHGATLGFSRRGNCWNTALLESFFASLKKELVYRESFATRASAERAVFENVEVFYDRVRLHSSLEYVAPATFESLQP